MRIVSLSPSGTEIVFALGLGDELVGRSHLCDHPEEAADVPVVTLPAGPVPVASAAGPVPSAAEALAGAPEFEATIARLDLEHLVKLEPDLVIATGAADRGSTGSQQVRDALRARGLTASVVGLDPRSLEGIFNSIASVGAFVEAEDEAVGLVELMRERLGELENGILERRLEGIASRRVVVLESLDPPVRSGRWVPELVRRAGGWELLGREGEDPEPTTWDQVREVDPEIVVLALAGRDATQAAAELSHVRLPHWFDDLAAVRDGELFAVDAAGLLLRPGPRIVEAVAVLAELFDPEGFAGAGPAGAWVPLGPLGIGSS
jgi:iron complex transport system substrate-binding protein